MSRRNRNGITEAHNTSLCHGGLAVLRFRVPPPQLKQHRPEQFAVRQAGDEPSLGDRAGDDWRAGACGCPTEPVRQFGAIAVRSMLRAIGADSGRASPESHPHR